MGSDKKLHAHRILWIEDDYLEALEHQLLQHGHELIRAFQVHIAEDLLTKEGDKLDLVLLDLMMDLGDPDIERGYNHQNTLECYRTGLEFYRRNCKHLKKLDVPVLVYTILGNQVAVKEEFAKLGLPRDHLLDKNRFAKVDLLLLEIERVLESRPRRS